MRRFYWLFLTTAAVAVPAAAQQPTPPLPDSGTAPAPASARTSGLNTDLILDIVEVNRAVPPGGVVTLRYVLYSADGNAGRVRLQVDPPDGWTVVDAGVVQRERLLEAWEIIREEVHIAIPPDTPEGPPRLVRVVAGMVDEPGVAEALTHVQVLAAGALRAGGAHLAGTAAFRLSELDSSGVGGSRVAVATDLAGTLGRRTSLSLIYRSGPQESRSNHRLPLEETSFSGTLRHGGWSLEVGNRVSSTGSVLTGPSVNGEGVALRRASGRVIADVVVARPVTFSGEGAGHLWRGSLALKTGAATIGIAASDFARPDGGYSTLPPVLDPTLDPDSLEILERERDLSVGSGSTRVQGLGLEAKLTVARAHRFLVRAGALRLAGTEGETASAPAVETNYSFSGARATFNARWRERPPSVQGVYLPAAERSADGTLRLIHELRLVGRAFQNVHETLGEDVGAETQGGSVGLRFTARGWRMEVSGNRRETRSWTDDVRQNTLISVGLPVGPLALSLRSEFGEGENALGAHPFRSHRGDLRWSGTPGYATLSVTSYESGGAPRRLRGDLLTSLVFGELEVAGGAWSTRGWRGGTGGWLSVGVPVTSGLTLMAGLEHVTPSLFPDASPWRASLGLRRKLVLPIPFLPGRTSAHPAASARD